MQKQDTRKVLIHFCPICTVYSNGVPVSGDIAAGTDCNGRPRPCTTCETKQQLAAIERLRIARRGELARQQIRQATFLDRLAALIVAMIVLLSGYGVIVMVTR